LKTELPHHVMAFFEKTIAPPLLQEPDISPHAYFIIYLSVKTSPISHRLRGIFLKQLFHFYCFDGNLMAFKLLNFKQMGQLLI
jgi:hypothetical protein